MSNISTSTVFSTSEFEASVAELSPRVAVFDCDGTLWSGDAGSSFMRWTMETGLLSRGATAWMEERYQLYRDGAVSELAICGEMVQVYQGLRETTMRNAAREFFRTHIEPNIFPELQRIIAGLQQNGAHVWAVSSTCDWVIEEGAKRFNIAPDHVLAACVEVSESIVSNRLLDVPTDHGKVRSLARVGVTHPDAAFGNSIHDAAMLAIARRPFPVNPTPALADHSAANAWPVYYPASVGPRS